MTRDYTRNASARMLAYLRQHPRGVTHADLCTAVYGEVTWRNQERLSQLLYRFNQSGRNLVVGRNSQRQNVYHLTPEATSSALSSGDSGKTETSRKMPSLEWLE